MRVELGEVELAGDEEDDGAQSLCTSVASGLAFGGLEEAVERLDEAVGAACSGPRGDAVDVSADHFGDGFHGLDLGAVHVGAPLVEHALDDIDLFAVEDRAQLLAV